jgi:hypothetical protein
VISVPRAARWERVAECVPSPASGAEAGIRRACLAAAGAGRLCKVGRGKGLGRGRLFVLPTQCGAQSVEAGGARQRPTFFARAKKVGKESTPRFRRNPESANLERAAKELASLKQLSPAFGFPAQGWRTRLRQRGETSCPQRSSRRISQKEYGQSLYSRFMC